ncbi:MAG: hypothetical protein AB7K24_14105 [Gemmataceae bacterium]
MGFLSGSATFLRYRVNGPAQGNFGPGHLDKLGEHAIGTQKVADKDGLQIGWIAGDHILDVDFELAKNIINDGLFFSLRLDTQKLPTDLLRAYSRIEVKGLSAQNPSGRPSLKQRRDAREAARDRLEVEARDGRYTRRHEYPLLWDAPGNQLLLGTNSNNAVDRVRWLFNETFGYALTQMDAGEVAIQWAEQKKCERRLSDLQPACFVPLANGIDVAWIKDPANPSYLGNEFLLWLWFYLEVEDDVIGLPDGSEVTVMLARSLALECPRGDTGSESIRSDAPVKLPEARQAIRGGKLPRRAGMTLVRHDQQYDLTLRAETLGVGSAKLPPIEGNEERARLEDRVNQVRHLIETIELLYHAFLERRVADGWDDELERMQRWLNPKTAELVESA